MKLKLLLVIDGEGYHQTKRYQNRVMLLLMKCHQLPLKCADQYRTYLPDTVKQVTILNQTSCQSTRLSAANQLKQQRPNMAASPVITLYTNQACPFAHRVHITLKELGFSFQQVLIDLNKPRPAAYLRVNPNGSVPTIDYNGQIIPESSIISQFLVDAHQHDLLPSPASVEGALRRARMALFVDAFMSKFQSGIMKAVLSINESQTNQAVDNAVSSLSTDVEPLLKDVGPFFATSDKLTFAEVLTGPFVVRMFVFAKYGLLPAGLPKLLQERAPNFSKWADVVKEHPSIVSTFDEEIVVNNIGKMMEKHRPSA